MYPSGRISSGSISKSSSKRPYRSHKVRACDFCRRRKARCEVETAGKACHLCHVNQVECMYTKVTQPPEIHPRLNSQPRPRGYSTGYNSRSKSPHSSPILKHNDPQSRHSDARLPNADSLLTHIVGPVTTRDAQVLEEFMSPKGSDSAESSLQVFKHYSVRPEKPVFYTNVQRHRYGLPSVSKPGIDQREIMENIISPCASEVIRTYFEKINPAFPMLDCAPFMSSYLQGDANLSSPLVCDIFALTIIFWRSTPELSKYPQPDHAFLWNLAVKALHDDFIAPLFTTLQAALLDLTGRPVFSIIGNGLTNGRAVALAYILGLNRNPKDWNIPITEQNLRIRVWWGVLIHDQWASLAHGTPPHIVDSNHDVCFPCPGIIEDAVIKDHADEIDCFISLCHLTKLLGEVLPLVYSLKNTPAKEILKKLRKMETQLDEWEDNLPENLQKQENSSLSVSGLSSLYLGFLVLKMLICRISLHRATHTLVIDHTSRRYHQTLCRTSAMTIVEFVSSLQKVHFDEFWMPYTAYHLSSAATLLLRCALETEDDSVADSCIASVKTLIDHLYRAKNDYSWELGDICISHCQGILNRMTTNHSGRTTLAPNTSSPPPGSPLGAQDLSEQNMPQITGMSHDTSYWNPQIGDLWGMFGFEEADFGTS